MNKGAFTGDHEVQLEDIFKTIVESEQKSGKTLTAKDFTDIRYDISQAYDEVIKCFDKENADSSLVTYAINLMKSTIATTNDLRNISQIAVAVSQSTIGALYLVNSLKEKEKEKLENIELMNAFLNKDSKKTIEELTGKIDVKLDSKMLDEIASEENEKNYRELLQKIENGDENAKITCNLIRKTANLICNNKAGFLNPDRKDIAALILVEKLIRTGETIALSNSEQLIKEFDLERYDIYELDENGNQIISPEKIKIELQKEFDKRGMKNNLEDLLGLKSEKKDIKSIEKQNDKAMAKGNSSLKKIYKGAEKSAELSIFNISYRELESRRISGKIGYDEYINAINKLVDNNAGIAKDYLKEMTEHRALYPQHSTSKVNSSKIDNKILNIGSAFKFVSNKKENSVPGSLNNKYGISVEKIDLGEYTANEYINSQGNIPIIPSDDDER